MEGKPAAAPPELRKKKQAGRTPGGGGPKIIDKTHEPPIQTGRYMGTGGDPSPGEIAPKTIGEKLQYRRLVPGLSQHLKLACPPDPEPPSVAELMAYLQPFWCGDHDAEMYEQFRRWTRPPDSDLPMVEAEADRAGMTVREWIFTEALQEIKGYVAKRPHLAAIAAPKPAPDEPPATNRDRQVPWLHRALWLVLEHPEWPDRRIAQEVGVAPSTLSRSRIYRKAAIEARPAPLPPEGEKGQDGVEAVSEDEGPVKWLGQ